MTGGFSPEEWTAVALSLRVALAATVTSLVPAMLVAHALACGRFPGRSVLNVVVHLPSAAPLW